MTSVEMQIETNTGVGIITTQATVLNRVVRYPSSFSEHQQNSYFKMCNQPQGGKK